MTDGAMGLGEGGQTSRWMSQCMTPGETSLMFTLPLPRSMNAVIDRTACDRERTIPRATNRWSLHRSRDAGVHVLMTRVIDRGVAGGSIDDRLHRSWRRGSVDLSRTSLNIEYQSLNINGRAVNTDDFFVTIDDARHRIAAHVTVLSRSRLPESMQPSIDRRGRLGSHDDARHRTSRSELHDR
jgi:hypothetical protein